MNRPLPLIAALGHLSVVALRITGSSAACAVAAPVRGSRGAWLLLGVSLAVVLAGCAARTPRFPGPLGPVGKGAPERALPTELPAGPLEEVPVEDPEERGPGRGDPRFGDAVADAARHYLEHRPRGFRDDCSGYVCAVYSRAGLPLQGNSASLWEDAKAAGLVHRRKEPRPGDLAFFDNTYDRNRNGRWDDPLSHVAVVLAVEADGTILLGHGGTSRGRTTMVMNLHHPELRHDEDGKELNSWLRARRSGDPKGWKYLSGELWRGFATLEPDVYDGSASP